MQTDVLEQPCGAMNEIPHVPFFLFPVPPILKTNLPKYDLRIRAVLDIEYILSLEVLVSVF